MGRYIEDGSMQQQPQSQRSICTRHDAIILRRQMKQMMANQLLELTGIRRVKNDYFITNEDIKRHEKDILNLFLSDAGLYLTAVERKNLYKSDSKNPAIILSKCILKSAGHPLIRTNYRFPQEGKKVRNWKTVSKYSLDKSLVSI